MGSLNAVDFATLRSLALPFALGLLVAALPAQAVTISFGGASGPGLASMSFNTITNAASGNDNVAGASPNDIQINQKAFGSVNYIDMRFLVTDDGLGTSEYQLYEGVANGTGTDWIGYQIELGFGLGGSFVNSTLGDGLDFDFPDEDSPRDFGIFTSIVAGEDVITVGGGTLPDSLFDNFEFAIDVPGGITEFTIRQTPRIVPEPATALLTLLGLVALGARRPPAKR